MRIAALAFGIVAGLVASLILALGGLDAEAVLGADRQVTLIRFGLFVVGNLGVFGAALVLAAPLAGAIVLVVAAVSWIVASMFLRHGPDFVMLTPPALLAVAIGLAVAAHLRPPRRRHDDVEDVAPEEFDHDDEEEVESPPPARRVASRMPPARSAPRVVPDVAFDIEPEPAGRHAAPPDEEDEPEDEQEEQQPSTPVRAGFFGLGGTANPFRAESPVPIAPAAAPATPRVRALLPQPGRRKAEDDWAPGRRRAPPPRQQSVFRELDEDEEDDDEPSGFGRFFLGFSNFLNFGLYAALVAAGVLIFVNWRNFDVPAPEEPAPAPAVSSAESAAAPSSSVPPPVSAPEASSLPMPAETAMPAAGVAGQQAASAQPLVGFPVETAPGVFALPPDEDLGSSGEAPAPVVTEPVLAPPAAPEPASSSEPQSSEPVAAASADQPLAAAPVVPYAMPPAMAVARSEPAQRRTAPAATAPQADQGL